MMLHKVSTCTDRMWDRTDSKQFDKRFHYYCGTQSELTAILGLGSGRKRNGQREGKVTERPSLVRMQPLAWKKKRISCHHKSAHIMWPWPWAHPGCTLTWRSSCASLVAIEPFCVVVEAICAKSLWMDGRTDRQ